MKTHRQGGLIFITNLPADLQSLLGILACFGGTIPFTSQSGKR